VLGLLASTGLRVGEAIRLQGDQVKLDLDPPPFHILETKFHTSRLVPLHPSTAERLRHYHAQRARVHYDGFSEAFFVAEQGQHLQHRALHDWFARLCQRLAIEPTAGGRTPCLMSFRHTFAVTRMQRWYQQGRDVQALLPPARSPSVTSTRRRVIGTLRLSLNSWAPRHNDARPMPKQEVILMHSNFICQQKRLSPQTVVSCRDTCRFWLIFLRDHTGVEPSALRLADIDAPAVLRLLTYLEQERGNSVRSRNIRLSAIRSFFRLVALRDPDSLGIVTRGLALPMQREDRTLIGSLTRTEIQALLAAPERSKWGGRRDHALLLTLSNSGARVSEVTTLRRAQVCCGASTFLQLTGQGRKERTIPLWPETAQLLKAWFAELGDAAGPMAFPHARGKALSREGVDYRLQHAIQRAIPACPSLATTHITPHVIRHNPAYLLMPSRFAK
jgi:site-specific recombinase XerD